MTSNIAINGACFNQEVTGVQRYARELTLRLLAREGIRLIVPPDAVGLEGSTRGRIDVVRYSKHLSALGTWGWVNTSLRRSMDDGEILWSPTIRTPLRARNHVPTIHDVSVLDHPEWFNSKVIAQWRIMFPILKRGARHIVTDSEFSRDRLVHHGVSRMGVSVVPCGVDERFLHLAPESERRAREDLKLPERYVLAVGSMDPRKNLRTLLEAWANLRTEAKGGARLVLAGGTYRNFANDNLGCLPEDAIQLGYVADEYLPALYSGATAFAFPSRYEGFGLPPLEAMASGTAVLGLRSTSAVRQVVGDAGLLVGDTRDEIGAGIARLLQDDGLRRELVAKGRERALNYTWGAAAAKLHDVLLAVN